jgi:integrase
MIGFLPKRFLEMMPLIHYKQRMAFLFQRKNGSYYAQWQEGGKSRRHSLKTKEERTAKARFNSFLRQLIAGKVKPIADGAVLFWSEYVKEFLEHVESTTRGSTYTLYDVALRKATDAWGNIPLPHITMRHLDKLTDDMKRAGLSIPTINKNLRHVRAALKKAYEWEYIKSPIRFPKKIKEEERLRFLSIKQLRALIETIDDQEFADFCLLSCYTALRSGELLRLTWADVDNPKGFLRISSEQKNKIESRVPINPPARAILDQCKARDGGKVFRFTCRTWVSHTFKHYAREIDLQDNRFHDLRHTFGSQLAMAGEDLRSIQGLMRHKSIASTMIYANVSPEHLKQVSDRLNYGPMPVYKKRG